MPSRSAGLNELVGCAFGMACRRSRVWHLTNTSNASELVLDGVGGHVRSGAWRCCEAVCEWLRPMPPPHVLAAQSRTRSLDYVAGLRHSPPSALLMTQ